jgi:hypothetical protein
MTKRDFSKSERWSLGRCDTVVPASMLSSCDHSVPITLESFRLESLGCQRPVDEVGNKNRSPTAHRCGQVAKSFGTDWRSRFDDAQSDHVVDRAGQECVRKLVHVKEARWECLSDVHRRQLMSEGLRTPREVSTR